MAKFIAALWLLLGGCDSVVLAAGSPDLGFGSTLIMLD